MAEAFTSADLPNTSDNIQVWNAAITETGKGVILVALTASICSAPIDPRKKNAVSPKVLVSVELNTVDGMATLLDVERMTDMEGE
jgi:hypothetical protein